MDCRFPIVLSLLVLLSSCTARIQPSRPIVPFVEDVLSSVDNPYHTALKNLGAEPGGEICIIGSEREVHFLSDAFLHADYQDNATASEGGDGLADFAGETITCIIDTVSSPRHLYPDAGREEIEKENIVRLSICAALDRFHLTPFDEVGLGIRHRAKYIVFADTRTAEYGKFDVDTLFSSLNVRIEAVSPLDMMAVDALSNASAGPSRNIGVMCTPGCTVKDLYGQALEKAAASAGIASVKCTVIEVDANDGDAMRHFLDEYIALGGTEAFDAVIVDESGVNTGRLKGELADLISLMNGESLTYRRFAADGFRLVDRGSSTCRHCLASLRKHNLFTHRIAQPYVQTFYAGAGCGSRNGESVIISESYVQNQH